MRGPAIVILVAACGSPPAPATIAHRATDEAKPLEEPKTFVGRDLTVGNFEVSATRGTRELAIDGEHATLVETSEDAPGSFSIERADREAKWTTKSTQRSRVLVRHVGDRTSFDAENEPGTAIMNCWHRSLLVASAGARRVRTPGHRGDCADPGIWSPGTKMTKIDALVCGFGAALDDGQLSGLDGQLGSLDETLSRFAPAPGVEVVYEHDECFHSTGLRLVK